MNLEKNLLINRDNQVLLNKLVEISHGKWVNIIISYNFLIIIVINSTLKKSFINFLRAIISKYWCKKVAKR